MLVLKKNSDMRLTIGRLIRKKRDPHQVYDRLFDYMDFDNKPVLYRRGFMSYDSDFLLIKVFLNVFGHIFTAISVFFGKDNVVFVREFNPYIYAFFAPCNIFLKKKIYLNLNHELNGFENNKLFIGFVGFFCDVVFVEPSAGILDIFDCVKPIYFRKNRLIENSSNGCYVFCGRRNEQKIDGLDAVLMKLSKSFTNMFFVGSDPLGNKYKFIELDELEYNVAIRNNVIVLLYNSRYYELRHSGVVLECLLYCPALVLPSSALFNSYMERYDNVYVYSDYDDLEVLLKRLLV